MKIKITADFTTTVTREIEVDDNFNPNTCDLDGLWYEHGGGSLTRGELQDACANLQMDEVWLVRNAKDEEIYVK